MTEQDNDEFSTELVKMTEQDNDEFATELLNYGTG